MQEISFRYYILITFLIAGCLALVFVPKLCTKHDRPSPYETFTKIVLDTAPEWDHAYITATHEFGGGQTINVWSYEPDKTCSSDHIVGIVSYRVYGNKRAEFLSDYNMRHLTRGHEIDPDLLALADQVRQLHCTHPCQSDNDLDAWEEGVPMPELSPCALEYEDGELKIIQIKSHQP